MSSQDKIDPPEIDIGSSEPPNDDDRVQLGLRLGLDEVFALEEAILRKTPGRRPTRHDLAELALRVYDSRRERDRIFKDPMFGEPTWDMLLALYALPYRGKFLGVMSLGHAANTPPTTALRYQKILQDLDLIRRGPHVSDTRQQLVQLTEKGRMLMDRFLIRLFYCQGRDADLDVRTD